MRIGLICALSIAVLTFSPSAVAQSLSFFPQRVVIEARDRTAALTLRNTGKTAASYRVELVDMLYNDDGTVTQTEQVPEGFPSAKQFIRFSPSQVRLGPGEAQKVRVLLRGTNILPDGEYRVHAMLRRLPEVSDVSNPAASEGSIAGVIGVTQAVALPVIVRRGATSATGRIKSLHVQDGSPPVIDLELGRSGNRSLYTDLLLRDASGAVVGQVKGVALPVPNARRRYAFRIPDHSAGRLRAGGYSVELVDHASGKLIERKPVR
jgi:hypothetical protein